jgi:spore coat polysaccharide biosynthesis protein SpsF
MSVAVRVIVQSRMTSRRLPGKALLPIHGIPVVALCALRAGNTGREVIVATSIEASDDAIVETMQAHGVPTFRGSLTDVLSRFAAATADLPGAAVVVRLTADNVVPDGAFVDELVHVLLRSGADYAATRHPADGLPYGVAAEAFRASTLRQAETNAHSPYEREHVTPWIAKSFTTVGFRPTLAAELGDLSTLRCTIDSLGDYVGVRAVLDPIDDLVCAPWQDLVRRIAAAASCAPPRVPQVQRQGSEWSGLTLGTAQLGGRYGIANTAGMPSLDEARRILSCGITRGVTSLDTARSYGDAERRIGTLTTVEERAGLSVVTKLDTLSSVPEDATKAAVVHAVDASVFRSCRELRVERLDALLLHRWQHRDAWSGAVWRRLCELRDDGVVTRLGASVYGPEDAARALADPDVTVVQLPANIIDWRWRESSVPETVEKRDDVLIQGRSVFLQGALLLPAVRWPVSDRAEAVRLARALDESCRELGRRDRRDLCVAYVRSLPWIHTLVIGAETEAQLDELADLFLQPPLTPTQQRNMEARLDRPGINLLDPSQWPQV